MDLSTLTVLITGSTSGIGLALAERFLDGGAEVIVVGRRKELLYKIKEKHPKVHIHAADVSTEKNRIELFKWATTTFPKLNALFNNAGVLRYLSLEKEEAWSETFAELELNLCAPIHLSQLFIPFLKMQPTSYIINTTSGLAFVPLASAPVYNATKAALHSFTQSLRYQLSETPIKVIELIPPAVITDLNTWGTPLPEYIAAVYPKLIKVPEEVTFEFSEKVSLAGREVLTEAFNQLNPPKTKA